MRILMIESMAADVGASQMHDTQMSIVRADSTDDAISILRHETFDLVIVDVVSLAEAGFTFIHRLRTARNGTPLVALTGYQAVDRVRALGLGADDAITQPIDPGELHARIMAVFRRHKGYSQSVLRAGDLTISMETREVRLCDRPLKISGKEYAILELLVVRKGQVVSKDMFLNYLYGGVDEPETKIVDVFICKLRSKLNAAGAKGMIATVWGQGYVIRDSAETSPLVARLHSDGRHVSRGQSLSAF
jgi:two-component system, cell cycle response regulator CtrA